MKNRRLRAILKSIKNTLKRRIISTFNMILLFHQHYLTNSQIKSIKRTAFGYSKFNNFKKRILIQEGIVSINA